MFLINQQRSFPATASTAADVREHVTKLLTPHYGPGCVDTVVLCVSEAFTNSLRHSASGRVRAGADHVRRPGRISVRVVARARGGLTVHVEDEGPDSGGGPRVADSDEFAETGRGMRIIDRAAHSWTVSPGRGWSTLTMVFDPAAVPLLESI